MNDDEEGNVEVDAADHSVSDHGRTHGTGCHLVHGNVDEQALGEISGGFCYTMSSRRRTTRNGSQLWLPYPILIFGEQINDLLP